MEFVVKNNAVIYQSEEGVILAEVTFPNVDTNLVEINHTFVDPSLRGQGIADQLLRNASDAIRNRGWKARPTCSYARTWFERNLDYKDLL